MNLHTAIPAFTTPFLLCMALLLTRFDLNKMRRIWVLPALMSAVFFVFTVWVMWIEGSVGGFWPHTVGNGWGNQIWIDLMLAVGIGWFLVLPEAKSYRMNLVPWLFFIALTGCIGFLAMIARMLFLREKSLSGHKSAEGGV